MKDDTAGIILHGVRRGTTAYDALVELKQGRKAYAQHYVNLGGQVMSEVREAYDGGGQLVNQRLVANVIGRGVPIGRRVFTDTGDRYQFYVKNHLGSTARLVNADGSYATTPAFDYQAYGELKGIREDSLNPVTGKYTGKELDTTANLYYFGARWYDQELGIWIGPDAYREFNNPYGRSGNPVSFVDADGNCELICASILIGIALGAYFGGSAANGNFKPTEWNYSETWDEILVGGAIGGVAGVTGAWIAAPAALGGLGWGATAGLVASSTLASGLGNADDFARGREQRGLSTNFGAFDVNWGSKDAFSWNNPYDKGDPWYNPFKKGDWKEDLGDILGWTANVQDIYTDLFAPGLAESHSSANSDGGHGIPMLSKQKFIEQSNYVGQGSPEPTSGILPKDMSDFYAYGHDVAYGKAGASGLSGLLLHSGGIDADINFVTSQLKMAIGFTRGFDTFSNSMIGWRQMVNGGFYGAGLGALAAPKIINTLGQGAYNNGY